MNHSASELGSAPQVAPMTGDEYIESIRDGREVYFHGDRVDDVTTHPAYRNSVRMIARLYDSMHDPVVSDEVTAPTDTGNDGVTMPFFRMARSVEDLKADQVAIAKWARASYGFMGRSPDYKASFLATLGVNADYYGEFAPNARRWYQQSQERLYYWNHAIINPPVDRHLPPDEVGDVFLHVEKETDAGLIVSGAKVVATGSPTTNYNFIAHHGVPVKKKEFALVCAVPTGAPGVKLISRPSYSYNSAVTGSPFDYPLSSRLDENDAIFVMDKVLVPWEDVLIYGDTEKAGSFLSQSGFLHRLTFHGTTRLAVKLDFLAGLLIKGVEATGTKDFRGVQTRVGEVLNWRNLFWALSDAQIANPVEWIDGALLPNLDYGMAYKWFMQVGYPKVREIIMQDLGSALIYLPSGVEDFRAPELRPYLDKYVRGSEGISAVDRVKLMKLIWDSIGTEFGGRHELYERNYAGSHEAIRIQTLEAAQRSGLTDSLVGFAEECMSEYDLDGWVSKDLFDNTDLSVFS